MNSKNKFLLLILILVNNSESKADINRINEIFHHKGTLQQIELGKIVLYLQQAPKINERSNSDTSMQTIILGFPETSIEKKLLSFKGEQYDEGHMLLYSLQPQKGAHKHETELVIHYDARRIVLEYALFDSISQKKGLVIYFHNKKLLDNIRQSEQGTLRTAACPTISSVVIDPGHGGHDFGAMYNLNICEKNIVLTISKHVVSLLANKGIKTYLTRKNDVFVPLDERTTFGNKQDALVISIHVNSSNRTQASGIETFYANHTLLREKKLFDKDYADALERRRSQASISNRVLADNIHAHMMQEVQTIYPEVLCDRGVKSSISQVLLGTSLPSVIVEVGFLSHPKERARLVSAEYQIAAARGIARGIIASIGLLA